MYFTITKDTEMTFTAILDCPGVMRLHFSTEHLEILRELVTTLEEMKELEALMIAHMQAEEERCLVAPHLRWADEF